MQNPGTPHSHTGTHTCTHILTYNNPEYYYRMAYLEGARPNILVNANTKGLP